MLLLCEQITKGLRKALKQVEVVTRGGKVTKPDSDTDEELEEQEEREPKGKVWRRTTRSRRPKKTQIEDREASPEPLSPV